jgi:hypothetical protein
VADEVAYRFSRGGGTSEGPLDMAQLRTGQYPSTRGTRVCTAVLCEGGVVW